MRLSDLDLKSRQSRRRVGRGISAGGGKTAGRGTKGQNSRSGGQRNPGFEGGQNPLFQRIPKNRGFRSIRPKQQIIKTSQLNKLKAGSVGNEELLAAGLIRDTKLGVKLLHDEDVTKAYKLSVRGASQRAYESLKKAGGSLELPEIKPVVETKKPAAATPKTNQTS